MFRDEILRVKREWPSYKAQITTDSSKPIHEVIHHTIPEALASWTPKKELYEFEGADGRGNISSAPWFAVFDRSITTRASEGYYIVYLLSEDLERLVLEIGFGATQFVNRHGSGIVFFNAIDAAVVKMQAGSAHLMQRCLTKTKERTNIDSVQLATTKVFSLRAYEHCAIYSLTYSTSDLPTDDELRSDYLEYVNLYAAMAGSLLLPDSDDYALEGLEPPRVSDAIKVKDFIRRPRKNSSKPGSRDSGNGRQGRRSKRSDKLGQLGEAFVFEHEKEQLRQNGLHDLASRVIFHREETKNRTPGWDVTSFCSDGAKKYIEVKSSDGKVINEVILTRNEWEKAQDSSLSSNYYLYLVTKVTSKYPTIEILRNPAKYVTDGNLAIQAEAYSLSLQEP